MLNISPTHVVSWPTSPGVAVPPVAAVTAVKPTQGGHGDAHAEAGHGRDGRTARGRSPHEQRAALPQEKTAPQMEAAPLLPYRPDGAPAQPRPVVAEPAAATAQQEQSSEQVEQKRLQLQDIVASVWQASAAVVDRVLGRDTAGAAGHGTEMPGHQRDTAPGLSSVTATPVSRTAARPGARAEAAPAPMLPWSGGSGRAESGPANPVPAAMVELVHPQEVFSYDESGASNLMPLDAGSLVSERA